MLTLQLDFYFYKYVSKKIFLTFDDGFEEGEALPFW